MPVSKKSFHALNAGLCADCVHARFIESDKGSAFLQCQLSFTDPNFAKYPRLPVLVCKGYKPNMDDAQKTIDE